MKSYIKDFIWQELKQRFCDEYNLILEDIKFVNKHRAEKSHNPLGFENILQIFINKKLIEIEGNGFDFLISQSLNPIITSNEIYKEREHVFKPGKRFIQPDITILSCRQDGRKIINEICEIKVEEDGKLNFFLGKDKNKEAKCKGDFYRLKTINQHFPQIKTWAIIVEIPFKHLSIQLEIPEKCNNIDVRKFIRIEDHFCCMDFFWFYLFRISAQPPPQEQTLQE